MLDLSEREAFPDVPKVSYGRTYLIRRVIFGLCGSVHLQYCSTANRVMIEKDRQHEAAKRTA
jgi:hypothetical protein